MCTSACTDQTSNVSDSHQEDTCLLQKNHDIIDLLRDALEEDIAKYEARLEKQLQAGLHKLEEKARLHDAWRTQFNTRLCAVEEGMQDLVKMIADLKNPDRSLAALPELRQLHQKSRDLKQEVAETKTHMENKMYQLEEQFGVLQDSILQHKTEHIDNIAILNATLEDKVAVMQKGLHSIRCMHIDTKLSMETRLNTIEASNDVTNVLGVLQDALQNKAVSGSNVGLNGFNKTSATSCSRTYANHGTPHKNDETDSCCTVTHYTASQESDIIQRQAHVNTQMKESRTERLVPLDVRPVSRECYPIME